MSTTGFFGDIKSFDEFADIANINNYSIAPNDWHVIITDVRGSTRAISEGRYKEVNMIGAACINAVLNITDKGQIPYVFGGDGATLLVPSNRLEDCKKALLGIRQLAESSFGLSLRVGVVSVAAIHQQSRQRVLVGKYRLSPGNKLATFCGGGIELAERWIKSKPEYLVEPVEDNEHPDMSGLSCRWEPLMARKGVMLSLLIQACSDDEQGKADLYRALIGGIEKVSGNLGSACKPVNPTNLKFRWPPRGLRAEIDLTVGSRNRRLYTVLLYLRSLLQWFLNRFDFAAGGYHAKQYRDELRDNTDYRRFDDTLRILLDCSEAQADEIDVMLGERSARGELNYGLHRSESALMTCLVFNLDKAEHIHFVDGNDGGFTSASKNLKAKQKQKNPDSE